MLSSIRQNESFFTEHNAEKDAWGNLELVKSQSTSLFQCTDVILDNKVQNILPPLHMHLRVYKNIS